MPTAYENFSILQDMTDIMDFPLTSVYSPINSLGTLSPYSGSGDSQGAMSEHIPMSISRSSNYITLNNATFLSKPYISIVEQPADKFRFRYKSEMIGTHGSLVGASNGNNRKKGPPSVKLYNYIGKALIKCTLVTSDENYRVPHAHRLVRRCGNEDQDDPHYVEVSQSKGYSAEFHGMGIIHTAKKNIKEELIAKLRKEYLERKKNSSNRSLNIREEAEIRSTAESYQKSMNLNSVALCFQAFILNEHGLLEALTDPIYSQSINNLKSALTGELKICRIDKYTSSCEGGEEVFILVEKVGKKNIKIKFFELNDDDTEVWADYGRFSELDVHHQYAIVFRTPPYKDLSITSPKEVMIQLERPTDNDCSEPVKFTYKPSDRIMGRKRARPSETPSEEFEHCVPSYHNMQPTEHSVINHDSKNLSEEIKKMLETERLPSTEFRDFIEKIDITSYVKFFNSGDEDTLCTDSVSSKKIQDDIQFAPNIVLKAVKILKIDPKRAAERIQKLLIERSSYGDTPLHSALRHKQHSEIRYILLLLSADNVYRPIVNLQNSSGKTSLHYAVSQNQPEVVKALLLLGADPNLCDEHGFSPLHTAVRLPEAGSCVDILLSEKDINFNCRNDVGWTPLLLAAESGSYNAVKSLIKAGVNINDTDTSYGRTALHIAVEGGHLDIVEFLLKMNINVNKRNYSGNTALHIAVVNQGDRAKELVTLLMNHNADPHIQNHSWELSNPDKREESIQGIKEELESEDENEMKMGQSSIDLASNKPEILQILSEPNVDIEEHKIMISPKQEMEEDDDTHRSMFRPNQMQNLASVLDRTGGWQKLAEHLNFGFLINSLKPETSPSMLLLTYVDLQDECSLQDLKKLLQEIGEEEALDIIRTSS